MMFVTWFATGGHGDGGFSTHQFAKPDMRWIDAVRKSHPGCSVAYVLDQDTQLETYEGLDVHRYFGLLAQLLWSSASGRLKGDMRGAYLPARSRLEVL